MSTTRPIPQRPPPRAKPTPSSPGPNLQLKREAPAIPERRKVNATTSLRAQPPLPPQASPKSLPRPATQTTSGMTQRPAPPKPCKPSRPVPQPGQVTSPAHAAPEDPTQDGSGQPNSPPINQKPFEETETQQERPEQQAKQHTEDQGQQAPQPQAKAAPRVPTGPKPVLKKRHSTAGKPPPPKPPGKKTAAAAVREAEEQPRQQPQTHEDGTPLTKRDQIAREILTTERTFVDLIQIALKEYYIPLSKSSPPIIPMEKLNVIFGNMKDILQINSVLLKDLEDKMKAWGPKQKIGDAFAKMAPFLKIYTLYVSNFDNATATLDACEKMSSFSAFLESCHDNPACRGQPLPSLLILPVQRIPVNYINLSLYNNNL